jgi:hypothetical protein
MTGFAAKMKPGNRLGIVIIPGYFSSYLLPGDAVPKLPDHPRVNSFIPLTVTLLPV